MRHFIDILSSAAPLSVSEPSLLRELEELSEKRRNPEVNAKESALAALEKYAGQSDVFVSFTKDVGTASHVRGDDPNPSKNTSGAKLGINPQTPYATPVGIYTYPIDYVLENRLNVPFAKHSPFLWVVRAADMSKMLDLDNITEEQSEAIQDACPDVTIGYAKRNAKVQTPAGTLWSLMFLQANFTAEHKLNYSGKYDKPTERWDDEAEEWVEDEDETETDIPKEVLEKRAAKEWSTILRNAGIMGVIDHGTEIIHEHEPHQAFFLDRSAFHELELVRNISPAEPMTQTDIYKRKSRFLIRDIISGRVGAEEAIALLDEVQPFKNLPYNADEATLQKMLDAFHALPQEVQDYMRANAVMQLSYYMIPHIQFSDAEAIAMIKKQPQYVNMVTVTPAVRDYVIANFDEFSGLSELPFNDAEVIELYKQNPTALLHKIEHTEQMSVALQKLAVKLYPEESLQLVRAYWLNDEVYLYLFKKICAKYDVYTASNVLRQKFRQIHNHTDLVAHQELVTLCLLAVPPRKAKIVGDFFAHGEPKTILDDPRIQAKWGEFLKQPKKKGR